MADSKQSKFELIIGAVDRFSNVFKSFNDKADQTSNKICKIQSAFLGLSKASGLSKLINNTKNIGSVFNKSLQEGKSFIGTVSNIIGKSSLLFGATGGGIFALAKSTANAGDAVAKSAARAGIGVKTWQEYSYAANLSNVSNEQLEKGFVKLQKAAIEAGGGNKAKKSLFDLAGVSVKNSKGEIKSADSLFLDLADKVQKLDALGKRSEAVNLITSILGEEGSKFMPLLLGGSKALKDMRLEAYKLGYVFSEEDAKASEEFNDSLTRMSFSLKGIGFSVGSLILPSVTKLVGKFTLWASGNKAVIASKFAEWVEKINIDKLWQSIENGFNTLASFGKKIQSAANFVGGFGNAFIILAGIIGGKFILSIGTLITSFAKLGLAMLTTPVGWFLLAVGAIAGAVYLIYKNWGKITGFFTNIFTNIKDAFSKNWVEGIVSVFMNFNPAVWILKAMSKLIESLTGINLYDIGSNIFNSFAQGFTIKFENFITLIKDKFKAFVSWLPFDFGTNNSSAQTMQTPPLALGSTLKSINETKSEKVERQEQTFKLILPEGVSLQSSGTKSTSFSNFLSMQTGLLGS